MWGRAEDALPHACHVCFGEGFRGGELTRPGHTARLWGAEAGGSRSTATAARRLRAGIVGSPSARDLGSVSA